MFDDHDHGYHYYSYGEEEEEYYEEYDDNYVDLHDILFSMFFAKMASGGGGRGGMSQHAPGVSFSFGGVPMGTNFSTAGTGRAGTFGGGRAGTFGGGGYRDKDRPFQSAGNGSHYPRKYGSEECDEDGNDDDAFDEMYQRMFEQQLRREEQREQERKKRKEHAAYMAERARKAHEEGRDFFESWNIKQLTGECQRRGIPTKGKQQSDIVELLINDEAEKRLRDQLKKEAPLLDEWAELIEMKNPDMNGLKVRVIDFFDGTYPSGVLICFSCHSLVHSFHV